MCRTTGRRRFSNEQNHSRKIDCPTVRLVGSGAPLECNIPSSISALPYVSWNTMVQRIRSIRLLLVAEYILEYCIQKKVAYVAGKMRNTLENAYSNSFRRAMRYRFRIRHESRARFSRFQHQAPLSKRLLSAAGLVQSANTSLMTCETTMLLVKVNDC
jgi:hypothetical protein